MTSSSFTMGYNCTIVFYIKLITNGVLFTKDSLSIATGSSVTFSSSTFSASFNQISITD